MPAKKKVKKPAKKAVSKKSVKKTKKTVKKATQPVMVKPVVDVSGVVIMTPVPDDILNQ